MTAPLALIATQRHGTLQSWQGAALLTPRDPVAPAQNPANRHQRPQRADPAAKPLERHKPKVQPEGGTGHKGPFAQEKVVMADLIVVLWQWFEVFGPMTALIAAVHAGLAVRCGTAANTAQITL